MFLTSEGVARVGRAAVSRWDWRATTILLISYDWDPARGGGAESLAGRRLVAALLGAGARVHVLTAGGVNQELRCPNYDATVIRPRRFPRTRSAELCRYSVRNFRVGRAVGIQRRRCGCPRAGIASARHGYLRARHARLIEHRGVAPRPTDWTVVGRSFQRRLASRPGPRERRKWFAPSKWPLFQFWRRRILADAGALTFTNPHQAAAVVGAGGERHLAKSFVVSHLCSAAPRMFPSNMSSSTSCTPATSIRPVIHRPRSSRVCVCSSIGTRRRGSAARHTGRMGEQRHA